MKGLNFAAIILFLSSELASSSSFVKDNNTSKWQVIAQPEIVIPGEESVIFISKYYHKDPSNETTDFGGFESSEIIATLTLFDLNEKEIFGKIWKVDTSQGVSSHRNAEFSNSILSVPFRVPVHFGDGSGFVHGASGIVQIRDERACSIDRKEPDWKCPPQCESDHTCIEIEMKLTSRLRQILLFTESQVYRQEDDVMILFQPIDESTVVTHWPILNIWIEDPTGSILYEWRINHNYDSESFEGWNFFRKLKYHLGLKASLGMWKVCATTNPWIERTSVHQKTSDGFLINCWNFTVISDQNHPDKDEGLNDEIGGDPILSSSDEVKSEPHFVTLSFGNEFQSTFQRNIPISGRIISSSSENELEICVQLIDDNFDRTVLEEQVLMLTDEAVFEFAPLGSKTNTEKVLLEVRLVSITEQDASLSEEPESLEITEGQNGLKRLPELFDTSDDAKLNMRTFKRQSSDILLASKYLFEIQPQTVCSMWTKGLRRSFKPGDRATVSVLSNCQCKTIGSLYWTVMARKQFLDWGFQEEATTLFSKQGQDGHQCEFHFTIDITPRMFPMSTFVAWSSRLNGSTGVETDSKIRLSQQMVFGMQDITISFQDRAMAILDVNVTEISNSQDLIGAEVFAEPFSFVCLMGSKFVDEDLVKLSHQDEKKVNPASSTLPTLNGLPSKSNSSLKQKEKSNKGNEINFILQHLEAIPSQQDLMQLLKIGKESWTFTCGNSSEDGFYTATLKAPSRSGDWSLVAISLSPVHGLRVSKAKDIQRVEPALVELRRLPESINTHETIRNAQVRVKNNLPIPVQVFITVNSSSRDVRFDSSNATSIRFAYNVSAYQILSANYSFQVGGQEETFKIFGQVTIIGKVEQKPIQMDVLHFEKKLSVLARGDVTEQIINDYFCTNENTKLVEDKASPEWRYFDLAENSNGVAFGLKSGHEVILALDYMSPHLTTFEILLGAEKNSLTKLNLLRHDTEQPLLTVSTPEILSSSEIRHYLITWKQIEGLLKFSTRFSSPPNANSGLPVNDNIIFTWPIPPSSTPKRIGIKTIPGAAQFPSIRFWSMHNEEESIDEPQDGGHNRIFNIEIPKAAINSTAEVDFKINSDFSLPIHGALETSEESRRPETLESVFLELYDAVSLVFMGRLENRQEMSTSVTERLHSTMQKLFYFLNIDGSFGEPLVIESFSKAMEQFYLLKEVDNFYHVSPRLLAQLQRWLVDKSNQIFQDHDANQDVQEAALDLLEWAPKESKLFDKYVQRAEQVVVKSLRSKLGDGLNSIKLSRHVAALLRVSSLEDKDFQLRLSGDKKRGNFTNAKENQDNFLSGLLYDISGRFRDILNCELVISESDDSRGYNNKDLVFALSAFARYLQNNPAKYFQLERIQEIFSCIHSHSWKLLKDPEIGFSVVRALSDFMIVSKHVKNVPTDRDLKVSLGTGEPDEESKTWRIFGPSEVTKFSHSVPFKNSRIPSKIYFVATGYGCMNIQVVTKYTSFFDKPSSSAYDVALDVTENLDEDEHLFLTICIRLNKSSDKSLEVPTTLSIEMFSGFEFESLTGLSYHFNKFGDSASGVDKHFARDQYLLVHLEKLSPKCGHCFTVKYKRIVTVRNLSPAKLTIRPTLSSSKIEDTIYFHSAHKESQLRAGMSSNQWNDWTLGREIYSNGGVISTQEIPHICPCYLNCDDEVPTTTTIHPTDSTTKVKHLQTDDTLTSILALLTTPESSTSSITASTTEITELKTAPISESSVNPMSSVATPIPELITPPNSTTTPGFKVEQEESITSDLTTNELKMQTTTGVEASTKSADSTLLETSLLTSTFQPTQQELSTLGSPTSSAKLQINVNLLSTQVTLNKEETNPTTEQNSLPNEAQTNHSGQSSTLSSELH